MAFQLSTTFGPGEALRQCLLAEVHAAVKCLGGSDPEAIHEARKHLKKARAALRLVGDAKTSPQPRELRRSLRDIAHGLSAQRDREVVAAWLAHWQRVTRREEERQLATRLHHALAASQPRASSGRSRAAALSGLEAVACQLETLSWDAVTGKILAAQVERAQRRMRQAERAFAASTTEADLHEWRKRAKDFWYQLRLLSPQLRRRLRPLPDLLRVLTETQGKRHDLDLVRHLLLNSSTLPLSASERAGLEQRLEQESTRLLARLRRLAKAVGRHVHGRCLKRSAWHES